MDVYKLKTTDHGFKKIERTQFESDTAMTWPYYQKNDAGTTSQFAVCPACNNPTQLILLYPEKADCGRRAYGKHVSHDVGQRILEKIDGAYFNERNQLLCREGKFLNVQFCFSGHASKVEDNALKETMEFMVTQVFDKKPNALYRDMGRIHQCTLELDHLYFQNLVQLPENHPNRNMRLVEMARTLIRA